MKKILTVILFSILAITTLFLLIYFTIPINRVNLHSQLIMLGDLNNDNRWDKKDIELLDTFTRDPFSFDRMTAIRVDLNKNGFIDEEDVLLMNHLCAHGDPYEAQKQFTRMNKAFPNPRELFRYIPSTEYIQHPIYLLRSKASKASPLNFISRINFATESRYTDQLKTEIYNESLRFTFAYMKRRDTLTEFEKIYIQGKINHCNTLFAKGDYYNLLLNLMSIVEDAETLTVKNQTPFINNILFFRDHLRELLKSDVYADFRKGDVPYETVFAEIEKHLLNDFNVEIKLDKQKAPRDFLKLENYSDRAEWQFWKSTARKKEIMQLLLYAQYDRRYLRASAKTSIKHDDIELQNHNLPMILLFREAMRINKGNKKGAVGLIDESVRIPFSWIKMIPREKLPKSIALENFLLPGNKEDGSDKSRHWNVFGGISLYKSPEESLILGLRRELADLSRDNHSPEAMTEFIRDIIANLNGIYHVVAVDINSVYKNEL